MTDHTHQENTPIPDKLTCQQITALLVDYLTEEMAPDLRLVFARHLHNCKDCRAFLETYKDTIRATRAVRTEDIPDEMLNRVQQFIHARMKGSRPS
jgi:predicted anti-sigma-YlaC factor YlaD